MEAVSKIESSGSLYVWIDEMVPCLQDTETGEIKETVVFKIHSRSYLKEFKRKNGWHINWNELPKDVEVYALALKENNEIQGLVAVKNDTDAETAFIQWSCAAPRNNKHDFGTQKYSGVGGHLFAIAVDKSIEWGYDGAIYGYAANADLVKHYETQFHAEHIPIRHPYQIIIIPYFARKILEVYRYEWN